ncbi:hypothetical protein KM043_018280 [Ampulex compressa]|nr:hypothetical protein KM043_018280 [Ampulex compressa]
MYDFQENNESTPRRYASETNDRPALGGWTYLLVLAGVTCCLGSAVPAGFNIGVTNNPAELIKNFCNNSVTERYGVQLSQNGLDVLWSAVVSIFLIGGVSGSLIASWMANRLGRKSTLCIGNICGVVAAIIFLLVRVLNSIELLLLGRLIIGFSGGFATSLVPMYMAEIAPLRLRGAVGVLCQLGITCGVLLGQIAGLDTVLGTINSWHYMLASFAPLSGIALLYTYISLPESPKYLYIIKENKDKALEELSLLRNMDTILLQDEVTSLQQELEMKTSSDRWTINRLFKDPALKLPLFMICSQYATLGTGIANIAMALISVPVMSSLNRRSVLLSSCYLCVGCLIILCISIALIHAVTFMPWICTIAVLAYVIFYGIGLGPIPFFIGSEIFDVGPRPAAMALGSVFNWGGNFLVGMAFPTVQALIGPYVFLIFAGCIFMLSQTITIYLPETRGQNTTDIASTMTRGFRSRPNAIPVAEIRA